MEKHGEFWLIRFFFFPLTAAAHSEFSGTDVLIFESERPLIYSLEDIEIATCNFDETKKIGEGGFGSVYFGVLGEQVRSLFPLSPLLSRHSEDPFGKQFSRICWFGNKSGGGREEDEI